MSIFKIIHEVNLKNQSLKIQQEYPEHLQYLLTSYVTFFWEVKKDLPPAKLIYEDDKYKETLSSLKELGIFLKQNKISLLELAKFKTNEFSSFLSSFLNLGRVIKNHPLYEFLKPKYQINNLDEISPRLKGEYLLFFTYAPRPSNDFEPPITEVKCSIINFDYQTEERYYPCKNN